MTIVNKAADLNEYTKAFDAHMNKAQQQHFGTPERVIEVVEGRIGERRFGNFGVYHAVQTGEDHRYIIVGGVHGTVVFDEEGNIHVNGGFADPESNAFRPEYHHALMKLFLGGYPMHLLIDVMDYEHVCEPLPTREFADRFIALVGEL